MISKKFLYFIIIFCFLLSPFNFSEAAEFDPGFIISDFEMTDYTSLAQESIQKFLDTKTGTLKNYKALDKDGNEKLVSQIIFEVSQTYKINPKYLLTLLQKEQSLIDDPTPTQDQYDWATGYGICDTCDKNDPELAHFKGFAQQLHSAAAQMEYYLEHPNEFSFIAGQTYIVDGHEITLATIATAALYNYTPHYHGNFIFWKNWQKWFVTTYPDGSLLKTSDDSVVYYIQNGLKRPILSWAALVSKFDPRKIIIVSREELQKYNTGLAIEFPEFSLIRSPRGTIYLLADDKKKGIVSMDVFRTIGFNLDEVIDLDWDEINKYPEGEPITSNSIYPTGALLQNKLTGGVYYVKDGIKNPIYSKEILKSNFTGKTIIPVSSDELEKYTLGEPVKFKDGELVTSDKTKTVYVVSNGSKCPIFSGEVFEKLGYKWENIIKTTQKALDIHPTGVTIILSF